MTSSNAVRREFRSVEDRLAEWRRASLWRQRRIDELAQVPDPGYDARNLVAHPSAVVRVDGFLGTINGEPAVAYAPPERIVAAGYAFACERRPHPVLDTLRRRYGLDRVAGEGSDLGRAVRLRDWVKSRWPHRLPLANPAYDGLAILDRAARGETFICMHYSVTLVHCCLALGIEARVVNIHRGIADSYPIGGEACADPPVDEHVTAEVFCGELGRWAMLDPDFDCHYERGGEPLSAWEIHRALVDGELDTLEVVRGPGAAEYASLGADFYERKLPTYYAHVSLLLRNDFLSDPDGPVPVFHPVDEATPPILWYRGEDLRLRRDLLGPLVVAAPYTDRTPLLGDGSLESGWASSDEPREHWVEITLAESAAVETVALHWPEWQSRSRTSRTYRLEGRSGNEWRTLANIRDNPERPWTVHELEPLPLDGLRIAQPPGGGFSEHPNRLWLTQVECLEATVA
jgi:hypothetical protein